MTAITSSDVRKPFVVAAMKAKLGQNTRLTLLDFDKATNTFTANAPFLHQTVSVLASEIENLPVVEKVVLVAKFADADMPAAIIEFVRSNAVARAAARRIHTAWLSDDYTKPSTVARSVWTTNPEVATFLGVSQAKSMKILRSMVEAGTLAAGHAGEATTFIPADTDLLVSLGQVIINNPRLR